MDEEERQALDAAIAGKPVVASYTSEQLRELASRLAPSTDDDVCIGWRGERLDTTEKLIAYLNSDRAIAPDEFDVS